MADHQDTGLLGIYTAVGKEQERQALDTVRDVVERLLQEGPSQEELDRAREQAKANLLMGAESIQARMSHLGASALLYGRVQETEEIISLYDSATRAQLRDLAREIFHWDLASLSALGRVEAGGQYRRWLEG